jgi:hypothetical protein
MAHAKVAQKMKVHLQRTHLFLLSMSDALKQGGHLNWLFNKPGN